MSVNFLRYKPGTRLKIPINFVNADASQDIRRGCFLVRVNNFLECECDEEIPANITIDLSNVKKGDVIRLSKIQLPPKVRPSKRVPLDYVFAVIQASRS